MEREIEIGQGMDERGKALPSREIQGEEELENLFAAIGNHELKALALGVMREGIIYPGKAFHRRLLEIQGVPPYVWSLHKSIPVDYCTQSLSPIGLVTREVVDPNLSIYGYMITPYGSTIGKSLAGHLLEFSLQHPYSLIEIMGKTASSSNSRKVQTSEGEEADYRKRAPSIRLKIFWELATNASLPIRETDLVIAIGEGKNLVNTHISSLARFGIIKYDAAGADRPYSFYRLNEKRPDGEPEAKRALPTLTKQVYKLFYSHPDLVGSCSAVTVELKELYPQYRSQEWIEGKVSGILFHLERGGFLVHEGFSDNIKSAINITAENRAMLCELLDIIDRFRSGDKEFIHKGREKMERIISDPALVRTLIGKAREASPNAQKTSEGELVDMLSSLIQKYPDTTAKDLQGHLEEEYNKRLTTPRISQVLRAHREQFAPSRERKATRWRVQTD